MIEKKERKTKWWAAQLASFDFVIKYRPGRSNRNADGLSRLPLTDEELTQCESISDSTCFPVSLSVLFQQGPSASLESIAEVKLSTIPQYTKDDIAQLQRKDPTIARFLHYWTLQVKPTPQERSECGQVLLLVKQWERLVVDQDILYRLVKDPVHGQFKQIVLPEMLKKQLWTSVHDQMGHQGIERTMALLRRRCYWPKMFAETEKYLKN